MGKKRLRVKYTSKGERKSVSKENSQKRDISDGPEAFMANVRRFDAYIKGKNAYITVPNTGANAKREPFIRIPAKEHFNNTYGTSEEGKRKKDMFLANRTFKMPNRKEEEWAEYDRLMSEQK